MRIFLGVLFYVNLGLGLTLLIGCSTPLQKDSDTLSSGEISKKNERVFPKDPLPVEVPFRLWMASHFLEKEPLSFWVESKEATVLQFQIFPCEHNPFQAGLKKRVVQHQQWIVPGLQKVQLHTPLEEGFFVLKVLHWDWLTYIPFSCSNLKPYWFHQEGRYAVVFPTTLAPTKVFFSSQEKSLTKPFLRTSEERFAIENPPCYFSLPVSVTPRATPEPPHKFSVPTFWRVSFPEQGLQYETLLPEKNTSLSKPSPALVGMLSTHFLPAPGKVKLKLQLLGSQAVSETQQVLVSILAPSGTLMFPYPLQQGELREEFLIQETGFHQIQVEFQKKQLRFPLWVESGGLSDILSSPVQFATYRVSSEEVLVFLQSAYPGTFLLSGDGEEPIKISFREAGFQVKMLPFSSKVTSLTLFSPFRSDPQTIVLKTRDNFSIPWTPQTQVWREKSFPFDAFLAQLGWSARFFSAFPEKPYLPHPKKTHAVKEEWIQSVLLEGTSLMEKGRYTRAEELLRQACVLLPSESKFKMLHQKGIEKLFQEYQITLPSQKMTLSWKGKPLMQFIEMLRQQTEVPFETSFLLEPIDFSCQEQPLVEVLARLLIEKKLRLVMEIGSVAFQKEKDMVHSSPSPDAQESPGPAYVGSLTADLSSSEFFFWQDPHRICYGMTCKLD